jgi:diacylglycerol kinase family enzyme
VRVALLYNKSAGRSVSLDELRDSIQRHRHDLVQVIESDDGVERLLEADPDVVAAAGGDGTVAAAARTLAGRAIPLTILPLGTANNIARSLGCTGSLDEVFARWQAPTRIALDLGIVRGLKGDQQFVEAVGSGLVPRAIDTVKRERSSRDRSKTSPIAEARWKYEQVLSQLKPEHWVLAVDGVPVTGAFLLVEVLNIQSIGPNLVLSNDTSSSDGMLSVVTAGEEHRAVLTRALRRGVDALATGLPTRHGRHITLEGSGTLHVDDRLQAANGQLSIGIHSGALVVLV